MTATEFVTEFKYRYDALKEGHHGNNTAIILVAFDGNLEVFFDATQFNFRRAISVLINNFEKLHGKTDDTTKTIAWVVGNIDELSDDQRSEIFSWLRENFCQQCGHKHQPPNFCQCENEEQSRP